MKRNKRILKGKIAKGQAIVTDSLTLTNRSLEDFQCSEAASTLTKLHGLLKGSDINILLHLLECLQSPLSLIQTDSDTWKMPVGTLTEF